VKIGDLVVTSAYGSKMTLFWQARNHLGIILDERVGPDSAKQEYLVHFMNGERHFVFRKEIKYAK
jgi:hypothetical protein